jgi:hypothetical protein
MSGGEFGGDGILLGEGFVCGVVRTWSPLGDSLEV